MVGASLRGLGNPVSIAPDRRFHLAFARRSPSRIYFVPSNFHPTSCHVTTYGSPASKELLTKLSRFIRIAPIKIIRRVPVHKAVKV